MTLAATFGAGFRARAMALVVDRPGELRSDATDLSVDDAPGRPAARMRRRAAAAGRRREDGPQGLGDVRILELIAQGAVASSASTFCPVVMMVATSPSTSRSIPSGGPTGK